MKQLYFFTDNGGIVYVHRQMQGVTLTHKNPASDQFYVFYYFLLRSVLGFYYFLLQVVSPSVQHRGNI